ncbi:hypothetical protein [Streptomyces nigra]|uniref:hypothetical protein n=1 Tax=Streptomyces nigra TaxID=1827580 RepID=UPI00362B6F3A
MKKETMSDNPSTQSADDLPTPDQDYLQVIHAATGSTVFATAHGDMHIWDENVVHAFTPYATRDRPSSRPDLVTAADPLLADLAAWREGPVSEMTAAQVPSVSEMTAAQVPSVTLVVTATEADLSIVTAFLHESQSIGWTVWTALPRSPGRPSTTGSIPAAGNGKALVWVPHTPSWPVSDLCHLVTDPVLRINRQNRVLLHAHGPHHSSQSDPAMTWWPALRNRLGKSGATDIRTLRGEHGG